jgi:CRP/FNR family transcriptional regulator, cyclic AMP receptor protein
LATRSEALRRVPLFEGMTDTTIEAVASLASEVAYPSGVAIVEEGEPGDTFIIIASGSASVVTGGRTVRTLGAGDFLGEISLLDGGRRTATVTALEPIDAMVISRDGFQRIMQDHPVIRLDVLQALTRRIREQAPTISD